MVVIRICQVLLLSVLYHPLVVSSLPLRPKIPTSDAADSTPVEDVAASAAAAAVAVAESSTIDFQAELIKRAPNLVIAGFLGFVVEPMVERMFNATQLTWNRGEYKKTFLFGAADSVEHAGKAYGLCILADWVMTVFPKLRHICPIKADLSVAAPQIGLVMWAAHSLGRIKQLLLRKAVYRRRVGKVVFIDKVLDFGLWVATGYNVLYRLQVNMGVGLQSLFAASGASAIIISMAGKGVVEQIIGGLMIQAWDAIEEGGTSTPSLVHSSCCLQTDTSVANVFFYTSSRCCCCCCLLKNMSS